MFKFKILLVIGLIKLSWTKSKGKDNGNIMLFLTCMIIMIKNIVNVDPPS